jgi:hypothetical protein
MLGASLKAGTEAAAACCPIRVVLSPISSCPQLEALDLALCPSLEYVLLQSSSITRLDLHHCGALGKVGGRACPLQRCLVSCAGLGHGSITGCSIGSSTCFPCCCLVLREAQECAAAPAAALC